MSDPNTELLRQAQNLVTKAPSVAVLTGAGISAESGIPTFRGAGGLWKDYRPEELASPDAFRQNPELVWEWYNWRRGIIASKKPNPGHHALVLLEKSKSNFTLITQNVDGLHHLAGSRNLSELHGSIWRVRCTECGTRHEDRSHPLPYPPLCKACRGLLRPDVIWFGEMLDPEILEAAVTASTEAGVMLVVGTSAVVHPAASLAWQCKRTGGTVIEVNLEETPLSTEADISLFGPSGELLPLLVKGIGES